MSDFIIETNKLCCKAGRRYLLKDISWQVRPGEHWVVYGMNGSGKTTLLSIIAGFRHFTSGQVKVFGQRYQNDNILSIRQKIGFVSSSFFDQRYTRESVLDIVLSGKHGTLGREWETTLADAVYAKALLTHLHLADKIDRPFDRLSKGERQNVLIARALFSKPDILILDEPCNGLDVYNREYLFNTIDLLASAQKMTIIYLTHYIEEIGDICSKSLFLRNGFVYAQGATEELFTPETLSDFLGYDVQVLRNADHRMTLKLQAASDLMQLL